MSSDCSRMACSFSPYLDGELDPCHVVDLEVHIVSCSECSERVAFERATRASLKRMTACALPPALMARMGALVETERRRRADIASARELFAPQLIKLRYAVGLAMAAGVVFAMGMSRYGRPKFDAQVAGQPARQDVASVAGIDTLIDDLVSLHANPLPPETTNPEELPRFEPLVGVPVRRPVFQPFGGSFTGARVHAMADRRAALLQYTVHGGHRVTVYVFDPRRVPLRATHFEPRVERELPYYVGQLRGYSVAAGERRGVGYALASDLDTDESAQLVLAALQ